MPEWIFCSCHNLITTWRNVKNQNTRKKWFSSTLCPSKLHCLQHTRMWCWIAAINSKSLYKSCFAGAQITYMRNYYQKKRHRLVMIVFWWRVNNPIMKSEQVDIATQDVVIWWSFSYDNTICEKDAWNMSRTFWIKIFWWCNESGLWFMITW